MNDLPWLYKTTLHTISFRLGMLWANLELPTQTAILRKYGGSGGISEAVMHWTDEFWDSVKNEKFLDIEGFQQQAVDAADRTIDSVIASVVADRIHGVSANVGAGDAVHNHTLDAMAYTLQGQR
jgi:hypothetical protein